jgi:hypothetical protein
MKPFLCWIGPSPGLKAPADSALAVTACKGTLATSATAARVPAATFSAVSKGLSTFRSAKLVEFSLREPITESEPETTASPRSVVVGAPLDTKPLLSCDCAQVVRIRAR